MAYIDANLAHKVRIEELAVLLHLSISQFCRAFKCTFGMPAYAWIGRRRMELAQELMLSTQATLSEIALKCGMSDQPHFTRAFQRIVGETPNAWRQMSRRALDNASIGLASNPAELRHPSCPRHAPENRHSRLA